MTDTKPFQSKVTPEILEQMKAMRAEGKSVPTIAEAFGVSKQTVFNHLNKPVEDARPVPMMIASDEGLLAPIQPLPMPITFPERMPEMSETPVFNHDLETSLLQSTGGKFLYQNGNTFTYAEKNHTLKKWVPDPVWVDPNKLAPDALKAKMDMLFVKMAEIKAMFGDFEKMVISNIEKFR